MINTIKSLFRLARPKLVVVVRLSPEVEKYLMTVKQEYAPLIAAVAVLAQKAADFDASNTALQDQVNELTTELATANQTIATNTQDDADTVAALQAAVVEPPPNDGQIQQPAQ